jgi:aspartate racemase
MGVFRNGIARSGEVYSIFPMVLSVPAVPIAPALPKPVLGVIGGLEPRASADFLSKLVEAAEADGAAGRVDIIFEQRNSGAIESSKATLARKLYVFDMIERFKARGIATVVIPCFLSHTFMDELTANSPLPIADMMEALRIHIRNQFASVRRVGILTSKAIREDRLFERYFPSHDFEVLYPCREDAGDIVTAAVYGKHGILTGDEPGDPLERLRDACADLVRQGAELVLPGLNELAVFAHQMGPVSVPVVDPHRVYAHYITSKRFAPSERPFKLGVVGGIGPAATVDFLQKVVRSTPASRDQDHIRLLVDQNPQIPDRTEYLIGEGMDPTLALYATCKKLQAGEADLIAIPCNTAHAFVERIQPFLDIPIINMLTVTVKHVRDSFPALQEVGLLATTGTLSSGIYRLALAEQGLIEVVPPPELQARVMNAVYGAQGVKAGFTTGACMDDIGAAIDDLVSRGCQVIILGCTELPLLFPRRELTTGSGQRVTLIDPTDILAVSCVSLATARAGR